jgi:hypothetical protein
MKNKLELKERVFFDAYIHESLLDKRVRKQLKDSQIFFHTKRPNKHYKQVLIIES